LILLLNPPFEEQDQRFVDIFTGKAGVVRYPAKDSFWVFTKMIRETRKVPKAFVSLRTLLGLWLLAYGLVCFVPLSSMSCGYHDTVYTRQGMLNWIYPDSLHVRGAIWQAQASGELPPDETISFQETERTLKALGDRLGKLTPAGRLESFSVVLVEKMLWSRYNITDAQSEVAVDVEGPMPGHLVVVTDEPVLYAVEKNSMPLSMAVESGLVKLYGEPEQVRNFLNLYDAIGEKTLASY
jgi:hypothetical protein